MCFVKFGSSERTWSTLGILSRYGCVLGGPRGHSSLWLGGGREDTTLLWVGLKSQGRTPTLGGLRGCSLILGDLVESLDIKNL